MEYIAYVETPYKEKFGIPRQSGLVPALEARVVFELEYRDPEALRGLEGEFCEMKRLYVRPGNRGRHIGGALVERLIADARDIGYRHMRLDTFPFMESAIRLYRRYGFYDIARYNDNPAPTALFMQLDL